MMQALQLLGSEFLRRIGLEMPGATLGAIERERSLVERRSTARIRSHWINAHIVRAVAAPMRRGAERSKTGATILQASGSPHRRDRLIIVPRDAT
jgi:hypothetical protein